MTVASALGPEHANVTLKVYGHLYDRRHADHAVRQALAGGSGGKGAVANYG